MNERVIEVVARDGSDVRKKARLALCECGSETFHVYAVQSPDCGCADENLHLQCARCGLTFCTREGGGK